MQMAPNGGHLGHQIRVARGLERGGEWMVAVAATYTAFSVVLIHVYNKVAKVALVKHALFIPFS